MDPRRRIPLSIMLSPTLLSVVTCLFTGGRGPLVSPVYHNHLRSDYDGGW